MHIFRCRRPTPVFRLCANRKKRKNSGWGEAGFAKRALDIGFPRGYNNEKEKSREGNGFTMITYALFNVKGGAGKTTTAVNLAHIFATEMQKRVLLVDLDPQSNSTSFFSDDDVDILRVMQEIFVQRRKDVSKQKQYPVTVGDLILDRSRDPHEGIYPTRFAGLDLMPADLSLSTVEVQLKANVSIVQQICLRNQLRKVAHEYDICILDLSPSINLLNINGLAMTDWILTPLRLDRWGLSGYCLASELTDTVSDFNPALKMAGCFFTQWAPSNLSGQIRSFMQNILAEQYIDIPIRKAVRVEETTYNHSPITEYDPRCTAAQDYRDLARYILAHFR